MNGLTGKIKFDQRGQRTDFELDIIELKRDGLTRVKNMNMFPSPQRPDFINGGFSSLLGRHLDRETWCEYEQEL